MKKVILIDENITSVDDVVPNKYYGVDYSGGMKAFVTNTDYHGGKFYLLCIDVVTRGNKVCFGETDPPMFDSVKDLVKNATVHGYKVYEFDTAKELARWLAQ